MAEDDDLWLCHSIFIFFCISFRLFVLFLLLFNINWIAMHWLVEYVAYTWECLKLIQLATAYTFNTNHSVDPAIDRSNNRLLFSWSNVLSFECTVASSGFQNENAIALYTNHPVFAQCEILHTSNIQMVLFIVPLSINSTELLKMCIYEVVVMDFLGLARFRLVYVKESIICTTHTIYVRSFDSICAYSFVQCKT